MHVSTGASLSCVMLSCVLLGCATRPLPIEPAPAAASGEAAGSVEPPPAPVLPARPTEPPQPASIASLGDAPCKIRSGSGPLGLIRLKWRGARFATFDGPKQAELRVENEAAVVTLSTDDLEITGEVEAGSLSVAPTDDELFEGVLRTLRGHVDRVQNDRATLRLAVPRSFDAGGPKQRELPCSKLVLGVRQRVPASGKAIALADGLDAPLSAALGGPVVGRVHTRPKAKGKPRASAQGREIAAAFPTWPVQEIARKGAFVQVRISGPDSEVEGWLPSSAVRALPAPPAMLGLLGGLGRREATAQAVRCDHPVAVYVRHGAERVVIGSYKPKGLITFASSRDGEATAAASSPGERGVLLGERGLLFGDELGGFGSGAHAPVAGGETTGKAPERQAPSVFVKADSVAGCAAVVTATK